MEIPALTLSAPDQAIAGSTEGTILDGRARREYRQQITDLRADVDEATANKDVAAPPGPKLYSTLSSSTSPPPPASVDVHDPSSGPTSEPGSASQERSRPRFDHPGEHLPGLGRHLTATVRIGSRCVYQPDPRMVTRWQTERL